MKKITIDDVKFFNTRTMIEPDGNLVPIESNVDVPFPIRRIFYVYGVKDQNDRGKHAHYKTKQVLICVHGSVDVLVHDGKLSRKFKLIEFDVSNLLLIIILSLKLILFDLIAHISLDTLTPVWNYTILSFLAGILAIYFSAYITKTWGFENPIKIKMPDLEDFIIGKIYILAGLIITANILTFSILNLEVIKTIDYFFGNMEDLNNIKSLSLSLVWAIYAIVIISTGIIIRLSKVRLAGMGLMFVPIIKLYVYDLWNLENIYRVSLFLILGLILVIGGFLYQKYTERIKEFLSEDSDSKYNTAIQDKYTQ